MDRIGTKDHVERETDEAERLVRPSPKVKPPRHDKRRERMDVDDDPDLDMTDKDLSKNYKTIGGSIASRVLQRWAKDEGPAVKAPAKEGPKKVRVRKKETGWVGWIGQDALKKSPGDYETVDDEDEGTKKGPAKGETAPEAQPKAAPPAQAAPKKEPPPAGGPKLQAPPPAGAGAVPPPPPITAPPPAAVAAPAAAPETEKPKGKGKGKPKDYPDEYEDFRPTGLPTRAVSKVEQAAARQTILSTFPTQVAVDLLLLRPPLHPDEVSALASDYHVAQSFPVGKVDELRDKTSKFYTTDPSAVPAPKTVKGKDGKAVPLSSLSDEEQATATRKHQVQVVAMSLAARSAISRNLSEESGAPKALADRLSGFLLSGGSGGESPEDRKKRASTEAEDLFYEGLKQAAAPVSAAAVKKILKSTKDPGALRIAVGYFQAQDYLEARKRFLDPASKDHISERQAPRDIASSLIKASELLRERGARYPEGLDSQDNALTFRTWVLKQMAAISPQKMPAIQEILDVDDNAQYDKGLKKYKKAKQAYDAASAQAKEEYDDYSADLLAGGDPNLDPPLGGTERGLKEPVEPRKPPRYDTQRKTPEERSKAAEGLWDDLMSRTASQRVAARYLATPISTYPIACAMGQNRQAVYWGVEPYLKGRGPSSYVGWTQPQSRDLGNKDFTRLLTAARGWLKTPVLATSVEGIVRDTQLRAALDLAIDTEGYASVLHPTQYNNLLARLAGEPQDETLLTVTAFAEDERSTTARMMTMPKDTVELKQAQADHFLARLDRMASTVQAKHEQWGMPLVAAKELVNAIDKLADEFEKTAYGEQSLTIRQASIVLGTERTAEVIQRDSDEKYMDTFANPQKPIQTEADEPYMSAYDTDDSSAVQNGSASNGRKLAP